jgi:hypothetical protein
VENDKKWRKLRFARNLKALIEGTAMTRTQFAERAQIPFPWLQRATKEGITRLDHRGRAHLEVIARWFKLEDAERLWDRDFIAPPPWGTREARAIRLAEDLRRLILEQGEDGEPAKSIVRLLEETSGRLRNQPTATNQAADSHSVPVSESPNPSPVSVNPNPSPVSESPNPPHDPPSPVERRLADDGAAKGGSGMASRLARWKEARRAASPGPRASDSETDEC